MLGLVSKATLLALVAVALGCSPGAANNPNPDGGGANPDGGGGTDLAAPVGADGGDRAVESVADIALPGFPTAVAANPTTHLVYVATAANVAAGAGIVVIDSTTDAIKTTIATTKYINSLAVDPGTNKIYGALNDPLNASQVMVIDGASNTITGAIDFPSPARAVYIAVNTTTHAVYTFNTGTSGVSVIDPAAGKITTTVSIAKGGAGGRASASHLLDVDSTANKVYALGQDFSTNPSSAVLTVIDGATNTIKTTQPYPGAIAQGVVSESGGAGLALVITQRPGAIHELDPADLPLPAGLTPDFAFYDNADPMVAAHDANGNNFWLRYWPCTLPKTGWGLFQTTPSSAPGNYVSFANVVNGEAYVYESPSTTGSTAMMILHHLRFKTTTGHTNCP